MNSRRRRLLAALTLLLPAVPIAAQSAEAISPDVVISQVYGGGGNSGATYTNDFVELFNRGSAPVSVSGWSVQYASSSGSTWQVTQLSGTLQPGQYLLVQEAAGAGGTTPLPNPDVLGSISMSGSSGKVALVSAGTQLTGSCPSGVVDLVGYGGANCFEGLAAAPGLSNTTAAFRADGGCAETDQNGADFSTGSPDPRNSSSPVAICAGGPEPAPVLVIDEIDYDQPGTDSAEFVEITNVGDAVASLDTTTIELVNGNGGAVYDTIALTGTLAPGDHYVVCANAATVANCDLDDAPDTNFIQNGAPDGVRLLVDGVVVDAVSYEGDTAGATEGSGTGLVDDGSPGLGISRCPDGTDTDRNNVDFVTAPITPGAPTAATCGLTYTTISTVQGSGPDVATPGLVSVDAIVTADYQATDQLRGFFIQEEDADADLDPATSEGIFVFCSGCPVDVSVGDRVSVTGNAGEFFGMSQISARFDTDVVVISSGNPLPAPTPVDLPAGGSTEAAATFESVEGMVVTFPDTLVVSEYFELARYGQLVLSTDERSRQFTDIAEPSVAGYASFLAELDASRIILDDDNNIQNDAITGSPDEPYFWPRPGLSTTNFVRGGDSITGLTGVLHWSFAGQSGTDAWRVRPVDESYDYTFTSNTARPATPDDVGGTFTVASFNVLNYFTTINSRGADSVSELSRQRAKIADAICGLDADVVGLIEIENNGSVAISDLLDGTDLAGVPNGVNSGCGPYTYVDTGVIGNDQITTAFIYRTATAAPVGDHAVLDSSVDPRFIDDRNRPALAQTFVKTDDGALVTVVVNHLKSKGSPCDDIGDPDALDGQGNCNLTRAAAAQAMVDWLATDPTGAGTDNVLIIGDLNSYRNEDPIDAIEAGADDVAGTADDYTDLLDSLIGPSAYSYVFDGQLGYLDHALAGAGLVDEVTGVTVWHINADEIPVFDYNDEIRDTGAESSFERESAALPIYEANAYRASDHDPVLVGLDLNAPPVCTAATPSISELVPPNHRMVPVDVLGVVDPEGGPVSIAIDSIFQDEPVNGADDGDTAPDGDGIGTSTASVRAERSGAGDGRVYHIAFTATDDAGLSCSGTVLVSVPLSRNGAPAVDGGALYDSTIAP